MQKLSDQAQKNKREYINRYNAQQYEQIVIRVPVGDKQHYKDLAEEKGMSLTQLFVSAVKIYEA